MNNEKPENVSVTNMQKTKKSGRGQIFFFSCHCKLIVGTLTHPPTLIRKQNTVVMFKNLSSFIKIRDFCLSSVETLWHKVQK